MLLLPIFVFAKICPFDLLSVLAVLHLLRFFPPQWLYALLIYPHLPSGTSIVMSNPSAFASRNHRPQRNGNIFYCWVFQCSLSCFAFTCGGLRRRLYAWTDPLHVMSAGAWSKPAYKTSLSRLHNAKSLPSLFYTGSWTVFGTLSVIPPYNAVVFWIIHKLCTEQYDQRVLVLSFFMKMPPLPPSTLLYYRYQYHTIVHDFTFIDLFNDAYLGPKFCTYLTLSPYSQWLHSVNVFLYNYSTVVDKDM